MRDRRVSDCSVSARRSHPEFRVHSVDQAPCSRYEFRRSDVTDDVAAVLRRRLRVEKTLQLSREFLVGSAAGSQKVDGFSMCFTVRALAPDVPADGIRGCDSRKNRE